MGWGPATMCGVAGSGETLDEVNRGFELMEAQDGIRSVIAFG